MSELNTQIDSGTEDKPTEDSGSVQLLTFLLDNEVYGTDISQIQEVLEYRKITPVPRTPEFLLGVINLRGKVVPVIDLRRQFEMEEQELTVNTCIVIVDVPIDDELVPLGILTDAVKEVIEMSLSQISPPPRIGSRIDTRFISGMGKYNDEFVIILNLPKVIGDDELKGIVEAAGAKSESNTSEAELGAEANSDIHD